MTPGIKFQNDFYTSVPEELTCIRLNDSRRGFNHESNVGDYVMFSTTTRKFYAVELKSALGKSMSIGKKKSYVIKQGQIDRMYEFRKKPYQYAIFILNFRDYRETYRVSAADIKYMVTHHKKKSITIDDCKEWGWMVPEEGDKFDLSFLNPVFETK